MRALGHVADTAAAFQRRTSKDADTAGLWLVQPKYELDQCGFSAAIRSDNAGGFTLEQTEVHVMQNLRLIVSKADIVEADNRACIHFFYGHVFRKMVTGFFAKVVHEYIVLWVRELLQKRVCNCPGHGFKILYSIFRKRVKR